MHDNKVNQRLWGVKEEIFLWAMGKRKLHKASQMYLWRQYRLGNCPGKKHPRLACGPDPEDSQCSLADGMAEGERVNKLCSYCGMLWTKEVAGKIRHGGRYFMDVSSVRFHISKIHPCCYREDGLQQLRWESGEQGPLQTFPPALSRQRTEMGRSALLACSEHILVFSTAELGTWLYSIFFKYHYDLYDYRDSWERTGKGCRNKADSFNKEPRSPEIY